MVIANVFTLILNYFYQYKKHHLIKINVKDKSAIINEKKTTNINYN